MDEIVGIVSENREERICENCVHCTWKYDAHVCFKDNMVSFTTRNSTCECWTLKNRDI